MQITRFALASLLTLPFGGIAHAATWVVDDNPGPGVDFTTIDAAIAVAAPNDVIVVRAGNYAPFTLDKTLIVLGDAGASVSGSSSIANIPAGERAALTRLTMTRLNVMACTGTVFLDDVTIPVSGVPEYPAAMLSVTTCSDVRLRKVNITGGSAGITASADAVWVVASRVEIVESSLRGGLGAYSYGTAGGFALRVAGEVHVARCLLAGGDGGTGGPVYTYGGDGGHALVLDSGATAQVSGLASNIVTGGYGGLSLYGGRGYPGSTIRAHTSTSARVSGVTESGLRFLDPGVTIEQPPLPDPTMGLLQTPTPGGTLTFSINAPPGSTVDFIAGRRPQLSVVPGLQEDVLTYPDRVLHMGVVDGTGVKTVVFAVPASFPQGMTFVTQAEVTYPDLSVRSTHSIPIILR